MKEISGKTALFGILADPIGQVRTPQLVNRLLREQGVDGVMVPMHVGAGDLAGVVAGLRRMRNLRGMVVTVPHKMAMAALCDEVVGDAAAIGAVNVVRREADGRLVGGMLDGKGFVRSLAGNGVDLRGAAVYMAGAGGAANAIAFALAQAGIGRLTVANRSRARVDDLAARLARAHPGLPVQAGGADPGGHDIVINATSLGMAPGDALPLDVRGLRPAQLVADIIMDPAQTPLLEHARRLGCRVHGGAGMLDGQAADMVAFFRNAA